MRLALLCAIVSLCFVTFPYGVPCKVWYLIISIPDLCLLYFYPFYILKRKRNTTVFNALFLPHGSHEAYF